MTKEETLYNFFSSFGLKAYDSTSVPDDAQFPYLTYTTITDSIDSIIVLQCNLWYRDSSWRNASLKVDEIAKRLYELQCIPLDGGHVYFCKGTPFAQRMTDENDDMIKRYYIVIQAEFLTAY